MYISFIYNFLMEISIKDSMTLMAVN